MDLKQKLAVAKEKIKNNAPIIIAFSTCMTIAVAVRYQTKDTLKFTKDDQELVKTGDVNMRYSVNGSDYSLRHIGNTPKI